MEYKRAYNLLQELLRTDFKLRYHGSYLGYFWSFLKPLFYFGVLFIVFAKFLRFETENYSLYLFLGIIMWLFFTEATVFAINSIIQKEGLMKKVAFPRIVIPLSSLSLAFVSFLLNFLIFFVFYLFVRGTWSWTMGFVGLVILELLLIATGFSLILSVLYIRFRDIPHIWEVLLQAGFWATPIIYPLEIVPPSYRVLFQLNPFALLIQNARELLIDHTVPNVESFLMPLFVGLVLVIFGYYLFQKRAPSFAEEI